jgi:hypothetical protein
MAKVRRRDDIAAALKPGQLAGYAAGTPEILECGFDGRPRGVASRRDSI